MFDNKDKPASEMTKLEHTTLEILKQVVKGERYLINISSGANMAISVSARLAEKMLMATEPEERPLTQKEEEFKKMALSMANEK